MFDKGALDLSDAGEFLSCVQELIQVQQARAIVLLLPFATDLAAHWRYGS